MRGEKETNNLMYFSLMENSNVPKEFYSLTQLVTSNKMSKEVEMQTFM